MKQSWTAALSGACSRCASFVCYMALDLDAFSLRENIPIGKGLPGFESHLSLLSLIKIKP